MEFNDKLNHINKKISNLDNIKGKIGILNDKIQEQNVSIKKSNDIIDFRLKNLEANINSKFKKNKQMINDENTNNFKLEEEKKNKKEQRKSKLGKIKDRRKKFKG